LPEVQTTEHVKVIVERVRFEVLTLVLIKTQVFWNVILRQLVNVNDISIFKSTNPRTFFLDRLNIKMEVLRTSETIVNILSCKVKRKPKTKSCIMKTSCASDS
jgi:hypothetical protein